MAGYDTDLMMPPSFAHTIHDALVEREEGVVEEERAKGREPGGRAAETARELRSQGATVREEARARVLEKHGRPGDGQVVRARELARLPDHVRKRIAVRQGKVLVAHGGSMIRAECPICPRHEQSWALLDFRQVGEPVRSRLMAADLRPGSPPGTTPPYVCSACKGRMIRAGLFKKSELIEAFGGPPELVRKHKVKERAKELQRERAEAGETWRPRDLLEQADREIPPVGGGS